MKELRLVYNSCFSSVQTQNVGNKIKLKQNCLIKCLYVYEQCKSCYYWAYNILYFYETTGRK